MVADLFGSGLTFAWVEGVLLGGVLLSDWRKVREQLVNECCTSHLNLLPLEEAFLVQDVLNSLSTASDEAPPDDSGIPTNLVEFTKSQDFILFIAQFTTENTGGNIFPRKQQVRGDRV